MFLEVNQISKQSPEGLILQGITFQQKAAEKVAIAGENGSGKSTLLRIIAGLAQPDEGEVVFDGKRVEGPLEKLVPGHPQIAYLSQHFELPKFLRVEQVLSYANHLHDDDADRLYELCQIDHLLKRKTDQLSGGERQRIALARILIGSPRLLLLDEPFSNLDAIHRNTLREILQDISVQLQISSILVSHDPEDTLSWADTILVMRGGQILQRGAPHTIYEGPVDDYVAGLFGKFNVLDKQLLERLGFEDKNSFVRPEWLTISSAGTDGVTAVVSDVHYYGAHHEVTVKVGDQSIIVRETHNRFHPLQNVSLLKRH